MATLICLPREVVEGQVVTLRVISSFKGKTEIDWHFPGGGKFIGGVQNEQSVYWDTSGLLQNKYAIRVEVFELDHQGNRKPNPEIAEETVVVLDKAHAPNISGLAKMIKENLDEKFDGITERLTPPGKAVKVSLERAKVGTGEPHPLDTEIRNRTTAIEFNRYSEFINRLLCQGTDVGVPAGNPAGGSAGGYSAPSINRQLNDLDARPTIHGVDAYNLLKTATQAFLIFEAGVVIDPRRSSNTGLPASSTSSNIPDEEDRVDGPVSFARMRQLLQQYLQAGALPYLDSIANALLSPRIEGRPYCDNRFLRYRVTRPSMLELIWSYFHEEGMLVQTLNAISLRFQNRSRGAGRDPLAHLDIDPLRPLNNLLWGYIQDEQNRLTLPRRAYEYDHHYGITLQGKAVPALRPADSRSKFLEAFHNLLYLCTLFYREDADSTVQADAFPVLNALREVHLLLAEGAGNQYGDLPWTARAEMLMQQWLLARPEMREFLRGRPMVPYTEPWMGVVDTMKRLQGWTDVSVSHFNELARLGEQILLSIRYRTWNNPGVTENEARIWARYWKSEIQRYIHSYRASTGADLTSEPVDASPPWVHLKRKENEKGKIRA